MEAGDQHTGGILFQEREPRCRKRDVTSLLQLSKFHLSDSGCRRRDVPPFTVR